MTMPCKVTTGGPENEWLQRIDAELGLDISFDEYNQRLIIKDQGTAITGQLLEFLRRDLPLAPWVGKIIVFAREFRWKDFVADGFRLEGFINSYFEGNPACLMSKFLHPDRALSNKFSNSESILEKIRSKPVARAKRDLEKRFEIRGAGYKDIIPLTNLYRKVFDLYPTPITEPNYLKANMGTRYHFQIITYNGVVISAASAEMDFRYRAAEMTDCATLAEYRGLGLMNRLVVELERDMKEKGLRSLFSLARAGSLGMNGVFYNQGYEYRGRLINNCRICTGFEDINIWEKKLTPSV